MYCPSCATPLDPSRARCQACNLNVQAVREVLEAYGGDTVPAGRAVKIQRWRRQRRSLGTLVVLCSLLLGCFIPISIGLLGEAAWLSSLVLVLAGLSGALLMVGSMLIMAADGAILTADEDAPGLLGGDASQLQRL